MPRGDRVPERALTDQQRRDREAIERARATLIADGQLPADPAMRGDDGLAGLDIDNNPGELTIALMNIRDAMIDHGWSRQRATRRYGIRGHPHFADYWPVTRYWGDARIARQELGLPLDDDLA